MKTSLLCLSLALILPLAAQDAVRPPRPRGAQAPAQVSYPSSSSEASQPLTENVTIKLTGRFATVGVDSSVTGIGPTFTSQRPARDESLLNYNYTLAATDSGYLVSYSIGLRVRVMTGQNNYEYRDITASGTVKCKPGKPVEILKDGDDPLILTVSPTEPEKPAEPETK